MGKQTAILRFEQSIYNLNEKKLDVDIHLILPLSKIMVYNMDRVFAVQEQIDLTQANRIQLTAKPYGPRPTRLKFHKTGRKEEK